MTVTYPVYARADMSMTGFVDAVLSEAWAMEPTKLSYLAKRLASVDSAAPLAGWDDDDENDRLFDLRGSTAVIPIKGVLMKRVPSWARYFGYEATATPEIKRAVEAAAVDPAVKSIALLVSSPGGQAAGVLDAADAVHEAKKRKRVVAVVEDLAASGAYWIASQAHEITASPDATVGSIGVYQVLADFSKAAENEGIKVHVLRSGEHKGVGVLGAPITDAQLEPLQKLVDNFAGLFLQSVARGRPTCDLKTIATGQVWLAGEARTHGLIDRVEPVGRSLGKLAPSTRETPMSEQNTDESKAALEAATKAERKRFADLRAAFPEDPDFAAKQYEAGASVEQAKVAYCEVLRSKLEAEKVATAKAREEAAKKPQAEKPEPAGAAPLPRGGDPEAADTRDFLAVARELAERKKISMAQAMGRVAREQPDLHRVFKEKCAERAPEVTARKRALGMA